MINIKFFEITAILTTEARRMANWPLPPIAEATVKRTLPEVES
jgi:hypothetical protein